jgi:Glycosyl transferase family 2
MSDSALRNLSAIERDAIFGKRGASRRPRRDSIVRSESMAGTRQLLSFVIPVNDEASTLGELCDRIVAAVGAGADLEIIFIDDGSKDKSWETIENLAKRDPGRVRGIRFRHNRGKAAALTAGFRAARGQVVFTLDADLQDDPAEIPHLLTKLNEGYDIVSGWKRVRHDPWHKVLPSRVFNCMLSRACGVPLHDHNCGFKCYRAEVTRELTLHGELHRLIPSLASIKGYRTAEIPVQHHPRRQGISKYGFERYLRGFMDMIVVAFLKRFRERPAHCIGSVALLCLMAGLSLIAVGLFAGFEAVGGTLIVVGAIFAATSMPTLACGLVAELVIRGGLAADWQLPISQDTAFPQAPSPRADQPSARGFRRISKDYRQQPYK